MNSNPALLIWKERVEKGDKHIALSNVGHIAYQQKYLLAMLAHLTNEEEYKNKKIGLVSFNLQFGLYRNFFDVGQEMNHDLMVIPNSIGSDFINWNTVLREGTSTDELQKYDLLLWDLPDLNFINSNSQKLQRFFNLFNSMLIVSLRPSGIDGEEYVKRIHNFYNNHGLKLPTLVVSHSETEEKPKTIADKIRKVVGF